MALGAAASVIFFAYYFEAVRPPHPEPRIPQRKHADRYPAPAVCTALYILMALVITGIAPSPPLNNPAPVACGLAAVPETSPGWSRQ